MYAYVFLVFAFFVFSVGLVVLVLAPDGRVFLCRSQYIIHTCSYLLLRALCIYSGNKVALARVEQLSPFPFDLAIRDLQIYPNLRTVVWAQEEPMNQGEVNPYSNFAT